VTKCGEYLGACRCSGTSTPRTAAEVASAHRESVRRAKARGWDNAQWRRFAVAVLLPPRVDEQAA
jgi:hypothetical protein